ncbi:L-2,4-diaminobutyrate decarboxylase [archaeon BMS3Bbin16]|nr:L-2,4-diaminobutyrate decarboxylase [archaeon BMS3Bbin16]
MDERGLPAEDVRKLLSQAQSKDLSYSGGRILGSMCTSPHSLGREVFTQFLETNLGDAGLFEGTKGLESEAVEMIAGLLGLAGTSGLLTTGGTEANILALWAARNKGRGKKVVAPETVHFSVDKACNLLGLRLVKTAVDSRKCADLGELESRIDHDTCAVVGVAGTTEYGTVDDITGLAKIALEKELYLHVDAAFGGFVLPFLQELGYPVHFEIPASGVDSITLDPHKMGLVPIPCGCIIFTDPETQGFIETEAPYLTLKRQHTVVGTRSGAAAAAAYAVFKHLGREGYRGVVKQCMENTIKLYRGVVKLGLAVRTPTINVLAIDCGPEVYDALGKMGWRLSQTREGEMRIIVMPHVSEKVVKEFLRDLESVAGDFHV